MFDSFKKKKAESIACLTKRINELSALEEITDTMRIDFLHRHPNHGTYWVYPYRKIDDSVDVRADLDAQIIKELTTC